MKGFYSFIFFLLIIPFGLFSQFSQSSAVTSLPSPAGTAVQFDFDITTAAADDATITLYYQGDFNGIDHDLEEASLFDENDSLIGTTKRILDCRTYFDSVVFTIPQSKMNRWLHNQNVEFEVKPTTNVSVNNCIQNRIQLKIEFPEQTAYNDAAMISIDSIYGFCPGINEVYATVANSGRNAIDSMTVNWEVNGVAQTSVKTNLTLDSLTGLGPKRLLVHLGNANFNKGINTLKVYTSQPNGVADTSNANDTISLQLSSADEPRNFKVLFEGTADVLLQIESAAEVHYEYGFSGFNLGNGLVDSAQTDRISLNGLTPGRTYDIYFRSICVDDTSAFAGPFQFTTKRGVPYYQNFQSFTKNNSKNPWPDDWHTVTSGSVWRSLEPFKSVYSSGSTPFYDHAFPGKAGGIFMQCGNSFPSTDDSADFISPFFFIDSSLTSFIFSYRYFLLGPFVDKMQVFLAVDSSEILLAEYLGQQQTKSNDPWFLAEHIISGYEGKPIRFKFRGFRRAGCYIDEVRLDSLVDFDLSLVEVQQPRSYICPGTITPMVKVKNSGADTLFDFTIVQQIDSILDSSFFSIPLNPSEETVVPLKPIELKSGTSYNMGFWAILNNVSSHTNYFNDTIRLGDISTGLSDSLTINPGIPASATNFQRFRDLSAKLDSSGICGHLHVTIANGTYTEELELNQILGTSDTSRITIEGEDIDSVIIKRERHAINSVAVTIAGTDYTTVKNITIDDDDGSVGNNDYGIRITGGAENDSIVNCKFLNDDYGFNGSNGGSTAIVVRRNFSGLLFTADGDNAKNLVIKDCSITGYQEGIFLQGNEASNYNTGNKILNCDLNRLNFGSGIYASFQDSLVISDNSIDIYNSPFTSGIGVRAASNFIISGNAVQSEGYGMVVGNEDLDDQSNSDNLIVNNMLTTTFREAMELIDLKNTKILHNSLYVDSTNAALRVTHHGIPDSLELLNNILFSRQGYALRVHDVDTVVFSHMDYNLYFSQTNDFFQFYRDYFEDLAEYKTQNPKFNIHSIQGNPHFRTKTDLHNAGKLAHNNGLLIQEIDWDIDEEPRPYFNDSLVDIGADEYELPPCFAPLNITVERVIEDSAFITFELETIVDTVFAEFGPKGFQPGSGTLVFSDSNQLLITGLSSLTDYEVYFIGKCGNDSSILTGPVPFSSDCISIKANYYNGFEEYGINDFPICWEEYSSYSTFQLAKIRPHTTLPILGSNHVELYSGLGFVQGQDTLLLFTNKLLDMAAGDKQVRFYASTVDTANSLIVGTADSNYHAANFKILDTINFQNKNEWKEYNIELTAANGLDPTHQYLFFMHSLDFRFDAVNIDEFHYEFIPSCYPPFDVSASSISGDTARIVWSDSNNTSLWEFEYGESGFIQGTGTRDTTSNSWLNLSNLKFDSDYECYVRTVCDIGDSSSWSKVEFNTYCSNLKPIRALPWVEGFENFDTTVIGSGTVNCDTTLQINFETSNSTDGRLVLGSNATSIIAAAVGNGSLAMDKLGAFSFSVKNNAILTLDLSNFSNRSNLALEFYARDNGLSNYDGDSIWIRGNRDSVWVGLFDLGNAFANVWTKFGPFDIDSILDTENQTVSNSFQLRLGGQDTRTVGTFGGTFFDSLAIFETFITGLEDINDQQSNGLSEVAIYPNPSQGIFNIKFGSTTNQFKLLLKNVEGKTILNKSIANQEEYSLNLSDFKQGIYVLEIHSTKQFKAFKLIKE